MAGKSGLLYVLPMKSPWWVSFVALVLLATSVFGATEPGPVYVIPVHGEISSAQFFFVRRALKEAERHQASAVVIDMDTYGGEVTAAIDMMDALLKTHVPTYTYVDSKAFSAGALITLATQKIYMAPASVIGAAAPVTSTGEDLPKTMNDKLVSALSAEARAAAQRSGHNPDLADAFVRKEAQLKIGDTVVHAPDSLLSLSAEEAVRQYNGKPLLAEGIAPSVEDMLRMAGLKGEIRHVEPLGFERLAFWLTIMAPLLLLGGIIGAYIEFKTPGVIFPGVMAAICFLLFFAGNYIAGLAGWEAIILFGVGMALVLSELILHPGTILPGVAGVVLIFWALIWAMVDRYPGESMWPSGSMLARPLLNLTAALVLAGIAIYFLAKYLPKTSFFHRFVLGAASPEGPSIALEGLHASIGIGMVGIASTTLRPSGKGRFDGKMVDVVTEGVFLPMGAAIRIVAVEGGRVVVQGQA